jgi:hypothetical protein
MTVPTKALDAYLKSRHSSLSAAICLLGLNQKLLNEEQISPDTLGRVARLHGMTPEQLAAACTK